MASYTWSRLDVPHGLGLAQFTESGAGIMVSGSEVVADGQQRWAVRFHVELDATWRTRQADIVVTDASGERRRQLNADGTGQWRVDGARAPELDGCLDIDIGAVPFSNTFVIRRTTLPVGAGTDVPVAFVDVPALTVNRLNQRYRHLDDRRWQYADETFGSFDLTVDHDGVVIDYATFATLV